MATQDESDAISTLTGLSLGNILTGLSLPSGSGLNTQLGLTGRADISHGQLFNDKWDDEDAVGAGQGEDFEDEVDMELRNETYSEPEVKLETDIPITLPPKEKKTKIVKRLVERPPTVFERFPAFEKDRVLDFTELFKGFTPQKSRLSKRPFQGKNHMALIS
jgi:transcription initiation factor TFIID subunit 1, fungi type